MKLMREKSVIAAGVLLILLPATGFPRGWKTFITVFIGVVVVYLGILFWKDARKSQTVVKTENKTETFTEVI